MRIRLKKVVGAREILYILHMANRYYIYTVKNPNNNGSKKTMCAGFLYVSFDGVRAICATHSP